MRHKAANEADTVPLSTQQLLIENAANRLLLRTIVAHLVGSAPDGGERVIRSLRMAAEAISADFPGIGEMPTEVQKSAVNLVRNRADAFLADFDAVAAEVDAA